MTKEIFGDSKSNVMKEKESSSSKSKTKLIEKDSLSLKSSESKLDIAKLKSLSKHVGQKEDTLYCTKIGRRYSWIVALGDTLSKEETMSHPSYYRFTMKNDNGHWQHIESMSKNELSHELPMCYYDGIAINEIEENLSSTLRETAQWFEISDLEGRYLLEERAYDAEGNLVMTGMFHKHDDGRVIVCFNDSHGFPIDFKLDDRYTYGHVFAITYDDKGKDHIVEYFDGAGYSRLNAFGCYQYRNIYDEREYIVDRTCHNSVGHLMNNKFGFAKSTLDISSDGKLWVRKHFDKDNNLIKPDIPGTLDGYMIEEMELDDFGQTKSLKYYIMNKGVKVNDEVDGVHCYEFDVDVPIESRTYRCFDKDFNEINK